MMDFTPRARTGQRWKSKRSGNVITLTKFDGVEAKWMYSTKEGWTGRLGESALEKNYSLVTYNAENIRRVQVDLKQINAVLALLKSTNDLITKTIERFKQT